MKLYSYSEIMRIKNKIKVQLHRMPLITKIYFAVYVSYGLTLSVVNGWRPYKIIISNHTVETFSSSCRTNASFSDSGTFNLHVEFLNSIRNPFVHTILNFESDNGIYDMEVVNRSIDLCKFYKNKRYEPIVQVIYKLFEDYLAHWFRGCPMKKGLYYLKNVKLNVEKLPPFFPEKNGMFDSTIFDKRERLYHINVFFQILKTFKKEIN